MNHAPQRIFPIRRDYNSWVANETLEDYALRYTPRGARKWSEWRVANTAFGGMSFLALEAIGGAIANQPSAGGSHVQWCANRYRSYRAYDNTFQPNYGPRKQCVSPY